MRPVFTGVHIPSIAEKNRLSRHTILRTRCGYRVHPRSLRLLEAVVRNIPIQRVHIPSRHVLTPPPV